jgi:Holliday junction resolvasome RuvABC endonuclease subunit
MTTQTILALDPGLSAMGVAVADVRGRLRHVAVLATKPRYTLGTRIRRLEREVSTLIDCYRPAVCLIETAWPSRSRSMRRVHRVARLCMRLAEQAGARVHTIPVKTVRRSLLGNGWAGKKQIARHVVSAYPELRVYCGHRREWQDRYFGNLFDAVALILYFRKNNPRRR